MKKPAELVQLIRATGVRMVDFRYTDMRGKSQHVSLPADAVEEDTLAAGVFCEPGLTLRPDPDTARIDGFRGATTLAIVCESADLSAADPRERDSRSIAGRAQAYLRATGIADAVSFGTEVSFSLLDRVSSHDGPYAAGYEIEALGAAESDDLRAEIALELGARDVAVDRHRATPGSSGRSEIALRAASLVGAADAVMALRHVAKNVASRAGRVATFMSKPLAGEPGLAMLCHQSLWKDGRSTFFDAKGYAECSRSMLQFVGGILSHADALLAFSAPTANAYRRFGRGGGTPASVAFSSAHQSAIVRIPATGGKAKTKRVEFRPADPSANPYLAFAAMLLAGIDGIRKQIDPVKAGYGPFDGAATAPRSVATDLRSALVALEADHAFLLEGGTFAPGFISDWIAATAERELDAPAARPHPYEFELAFDE